MAFCTKCGGKNEEGVKFCAYCGNPMGGSQPNAGSPAKEQFTKFAQSGSNSKQKLNNFFERMPFKKMAYDKIPAETITKFPILGKVMPYANQIVSAFAAALVITVLSSIGGGLVKSANAAFGGGSPGSSSSIDEDSHTVIVVSSAIYMNMSMSLEGTTIADINSFPQIDILIEDNEKVKHDWEIIKKTYNIKNNEQVKDSEYISLAIAFSYGKPTAGLIIAASFEEVGSTNGIDYSILRQGGWVYPLEDPKGLLPRQSYALAVASRWY